MNRSVTRSVVALAVVVVSVAALHFLQGQDVKDTIPVNLDPTNGCTPRVTDVIGNSYGRLVRWNISNGCANAQVVTVRDVVKDNGSGGKTTDAVEVFRPQPVVSGTIPTSTQDRPMTATIARFVVIRSKYHYTICTRDQSTQVERCLDPDVEIWP
jgi:hypothetical protein